MSKMSSVQVSSVDRQKKGAAALSMRMRANDTPNLLKHFRGHRGTILGLDFHPNLPQLVSCGADEHITIWNYKQETRALRYEGHQGKVNDVKFSKGGDLMVSAGEDAMIRIWVPTVRGEVRAFRGHSSKVRSVCFNPTTPGIIASGSNDKTIKLWSIDRTSGAKTAHKIGSFIKCFANLHTNWVRTVRYSFDGNLLCSSSDDNSICILDMRSHQIVTKLPCHLGSPLCADFNPCASHYVGCSTVDQCFTIHDLRKNELVQVYQKLQKGAVNSFAFHPSGDYAVTVGEDATIKILDLVEGRPIYTLHGPRQALRAVAFSANGSLLATAGEDKELLIWEPLLVPYESDNDTPREQEKENSAATGAGDRHDNTNTSDKTSDSSSVVGTLSNLSRTSSSAAPHKEKFQSNSSSSSSQASTPTNPYRQK